MLCAASSPCITLSQQHTPGSCATPGSTATHHAMLVAPCRASIEHETCQRDGHTLSPTERAVILDHVPAMEKKLMYSASLRK